MHRVRHRLREPDERDRVRGAPGEVLLGDAADRGTDEDHREHRHGRVRASRRERRNEEREGRQHNGDEGAGGEEPRHDVPVVPEERAGALRVEDVPREEHGLRRPRRRQEDGREGGPPRADVVERRDGPRGVQGEHAVAPIGADQERRDDRREEGERHHRVPVVVPVRRELEVVRVRRRAHERGHHHEDDHGDEREREQEPRRDLRADAAPEAQRDADAVPPDSVAPSPAAGSLAVVAAVAEVEDLRRPGAHDAASSRVASAPSRVNTSARE